MADAKKSILTSTKKALGIDESYDVFDTTIIMHINSAFATLQQIGIGPVEGFEIEDESSEWSEFYTDVTLNNVRSYLYLQVRLRFDPPATAHAETAMKELIKEAEWRLNVHAESPTNKAVIVP